MLEKPPKFYHKTLLFPKLSIKIDLFHALEFDDVMKLKILKF